MPKQLLFGELERPQPRHGTKRRWRDLVEEDVQAVGLGVAWYEVAQDRKQWEEVCRQCRAYDINKGVGHYAANNSNTNVDTSYAHAGSLSDAKEIIHDIPTAAPLVPLDFLLVNIQGMVPQDTAIILKMGGYKVTWLQGVCVRCGILACVI